MNILSLLNVAPPFALVPTPAAYIFLRNVSGVLYGWRVG